MTPRTGRIVVRVLAIGIQWVFLTVAVGSLVMRSDTSFEQIVSPHLGAAPMFIGAFIAAFMLGLTVESPRFIISLVLLMCICSAGFIGILSYAPVVDGILVRTTDLDNFVGQRLLIVSLILALPAAPGAAAGNLLGSFLSVRQEIMPHPEDLALEEEVPWWERRQRASQEHHNPP